MVKCKTPVRPITRDIDRVEQARLNRGSEDVVTRDPLVRMTRRQRWLVLSLFGLYLVLVAVARQYDPTPTDDVISLLLTLYVALLAAPFIFLRSSLAWFHPVVFSSLTGLLTLMQRISLYAWGIDWHAVLPATPDELSHLIEFQLALSAIGVASYYAGFFLAPRLRVPKLRFNDPPALAGRLFSISLVALFLFLAYVAARGGLADHMQGWARGRHSEFASQHYQIALVSLGSPACWVWLAYRPRAIFSPLFWIAIAMALAVAFFMMGSRSSAVYSMATGLLVWMLRARRITYVPVVVGLLAAIYVVGAFGAYRRSGWQGQMDWDAATESSVANTIWDTGAQELADRTSTGDVSLAIYARVPDDVHLLYGSSYLAILALPIPRAIWPGKPGQIGGVAGKTFFGLEAGVPPGPVGEAYWNFHIPGVVVVYFLFGLFQSWLLRVYRRYAAVPAMMVIYANCLFLFGGPSTPAFVQWIISFASIMLVLLITGVVRVRRAPAAGFSRLSRLV